MGAVTLSFQLFNANVQSFEQKMEVLNVKVLCRIALKVITEWQIT